MTKPRLFIAILAGIALLTLLAIGLPRYLHLDTYKPTILAELQKQLNRQVRYDTSEVALGLGAVFTFNNVTISEPDLSATFLSAKRLRVTLAIVPLLRGKVVLRDLTLDQPDAAIFRFRDGTFNISDLLQEKPGREPLHLHKFSLRDATIRFTDQAITPTGVTTVLSATDLSLSAMERGKKGTIRFTTTVGSAGETGELSITGKYELPKIGLPMATTKLDAKISAHRLNAAHAWPYYQRFVPFRQLLGRFDLETTFVGQLSNFSAKGKISAAGLHLDYQPVFHALLQPKALRFAYQLEVSPQAVNVKTLDLLVDGLRVKGNCLISGIGGKDPRITAAATTSPIDLAKFNAYIPYGIITKDVADYIEQHIKGGILHLDNGRLDGTVSQILNMGVGTNYNVLFISAHIENGIVSYGPTVPAFNSIKGRLELKGKDFILSGMSGKFGTAPLTMEGRITDYPPTPTACTFPFNLQISPNQAEVAWLLGAEQGKRFTLAGNAPLVLSGEGPTAQYQLAGNWQLSQASYGVTDLIKKPAGKNSSLSFKVGISPKELLVHSASYNLGPLFLSLAGKKQFSPAPAPLSISLGTNRFSAQEISPFLPPLQGYQPEGSVQATLIANGTTLDPKKLSWRGPVRLHGFGCKANERIKPLRGINGTINLHDNSIETTQLSATIGSTQVSGKGRYQWGDAPSWNISCASPKIAPADFGLIASGGAPTISAVQGVASYSKDQITIKHLSGQLNKSAVTVRGSLSLLDQPTAALSISSPHLEVADLVALGKLDATPRSINTPPAKPWQLSASVVADTGTIGGVVFTRLHAQTELKDSILYLQPYDFLAYGGKVNGKSRLDFGAAVPRYQISCAATNIDAGHLLADLGAKDHKLTGTMSISADLTSKGNNLMDWKKSVLGSAKLKIAEGSINRFPVLSKVFSILNVSQLLKLQLPDMVSGGMPFNEISATFAIADGILATKNLYMASDAINLSAVGNVNLPRNEISATIGVQPLQTIDKVVSKIPIVGWILTGKDKTLITTYFEAKGRLDDPVVTAIPVKSMAKGTLDIFKRIFTLPAKLITDTGEVLLNN